MSQNVSKFISDLTVHFGLKHDRPEHETAWLMSMARELRGFDGLTLARAAEEITRHRTDRRFPLPADCRKACIEARKWVEAERRSVALPIEAEPSRMHWPERMKLADDLVMGPEGRQAAKEGWIGILHAEAVKRGRLPSAANEFGALKRQAKEFDDAYRQCVKGGWPQAQRLERLGADMLANRKKLTDMVLHGVVR